MAYNKSYNPDALPAHAEPEQVAQMIGAIHHKPLPSRPPMHISHSSPQSTTTGASQPHAQAHSQARPQQARPQQASRPTDPHRPYNGNPPPGNMTNNQQQRPHPLHPSPPPQNYGFGPPPSQPVRNRPSPGPRPPPSPHPPPLSVPDDDPQQLFPLFRAANVSHSGALTEAELGSALVNGDYTSFHPQTVKMMVRMFDRDGNGAITFDEFVSLWRYLAAWRELFERFDEDRSGRISLHEFEKALVAFGYRLSLPFVSVLFATFESKGRRRNMGPGPGPAASDGMSFDLFVQACISLRRMTEVFKRYDDDRDGYITVSFEEFLTEILHLQD